MENFDIRQLNNNYAPGIATYGIDGNTGEKGLSGTSVYFTSYNLEYGSSTENEQNEVIVKLNQNKILSSYVDKETERPYITGDIIIDATGYIYSVYEKNGSFALQYISKLKNEDSSGCFSKVNDRVMLNYNGFDIINIAENEVNLPETTYPFRVTSVKKDSVSGLYKLVSLGAKSYITSENKYLNIYYNEEDDSFHFETESNIVFDTSSLMVKGTDTKENFSEYYKIVPYNDPVGLLHRVYSDAIYSLDSSVLTVEGFYNDYPNIEIIPDFVKVRVLDNNYDVQNEKLFVVDNTKFGNTVSSFYANVGNSLDGISEDRINVSLIKGVEIYIKKK